MKASALDLAAQRSGAHRKMWFVRAAERVGLSPTLASCLIGVFVAALTPMAHGFAAPIDYARKPFESIVLYFMAAALPFSIALLRVGERAAARAIDASQPFLETDFDPCLHPASASSAGAFAALLQLVPIHEINTSRWSRFLSGDWNLYDVWSCLVIFFVIVTSFQAIAAMLFLARSVGQLGARVSLHLFDPARGRPMAQVAVRLALMTAMFGVAIGLTGMVGLWAPITAIWSATLNFVGAGVFLVLCIGPFVRAMSRLRVQELARIHTALAGRREVLAESPMGRQVRDLNLVELLAYRREVASASVWPLNAALWGRWFLYLVLPPLSWVAAAIVEEVVQGALPR